MSDAIMPAELETWLGWYERMWTIRLFEEHAIASFRKGLFTGSTHPCIGQEAIAVGGAAALAATDQVFATYRGHGHALAKGLDANALMAELLCRATGCSGGRGGSMHLCDVAMDFWGTNAVVAAHIPIAGGMAFANQLRGEKRVVVVYFGDGATCEGAFFETLNMAALWKLPLVLVCENNGYAISVPTRMAIPLDDIADRAKGFALPGATVDGNDPVAVHDAMAIAVARARDGGGPTLVECKTVRWERHSAISAGKYADETEAMKWKTVDPLPRFAERLRRAGSAADRLQECQDRARRITDDALRFAIASAEPDPGTVADHVYA